MILAKSGPFKTGDVRNTTTSRWESAPTEMAISELYIHLSFHTQLRQTGTCRTIHSHSVLNVYFRVIQISTLKCLFLHNLLISPLVTWIPSHGFDETAKEHLLGNNRNTASTTLAWCFRVLYYIPNRYLQSNNPDDIKLESKTQSKRIAQKTVSCMVRDTVMRGCIQFPY